MKSVKKSDIEHKYYAICPHCDNETRVEYDEIQEGQILCEECLETFLIED